MIRGNDDEEDLKRKATAVFSLFDDDNDDFVDFRLVQEQILSMKMPEAVKEIVSSALSSLTPSSDGQISRSDFVSAFLVASSPSSPSLSPSSPSTFFSSSSSFSPSHYSSPSFSSSIQKSDDFEDMVEKELFNEVSEENENLRLQIGELEDRISHLEGKQIVDLEREVGELVDALKEAEEDKKVGDLLRGDVEKMANTIHSLEEKIEDKEKIIFSLAEDKQKTDREHTQQQQHLEQDRQQLQQQLHLTEKKLVFLMGEREKKEGGLMKDAEESKEQLEIVASTLSSEEKRRKQLEEENDDLQKELENSNNQNTIFQEKIAQLEHEKEQLEHVISSQNEKLVDKRKIDEEQERWLEDLQRGEEEEEEEEEEVEQSFLDSLWHACYFSLCAPAPPHGFRKFIDE